MFVDLTAAYGTVCHSGLACKLLQLLPDRHMVRIVMEVVGNRSLPLPPATANGAGYYASKTASHRDLSWPSFSSTSTSKTCQVASPETVSTQVYADDLAIMHAGGDCQAVEEVLNKDMASVDEYLQTWKLKRNTTEMVSEVFHLNNKEAKREVKANLHNKTLPFRSNPNTSE